MDSKHASDSSKKDAPTTVQSVASTNKESQPPSSSESSSWRSKLHIHRSTSPPVPGKEKWRDATLSDKERWKEWQKAKDKEQMKGSTTAAFTGFYKGKGKTGYWMDIFW